MKQEAQSIQEQAQEVLEQKQELVAKISALQIKDKEIERTLEQKTGKKTENAGVKTTAAVAIGKQRVEATKPKVKEALTINTFDEHVPATQATTLTGASAAMSIASIKKTVKKKLDDTISQASTRTARVKQTKVTPVKRTPRTPKTPRKPRTPKGGQKKDDLPKEEKTRKRDNKAQTKTRVKLAAAAEKANE